MNCFVFKELHCLLFKFNIVFSIWKKKGTILIEKSINFCVKAVKESNCEQKFNSQLYSQNVVCIKIHKGNHASKCLVIVWLAEFCSNEMGTK